MAKTKQIIFGATSTQKNYSPEFHKTAAKNKPFATIGGRIDDYAIIYKTEGAKAAKAAIKETYPEDWAEVYAGLKIYIKGGTDAYYER